LDGIEALAGVKIPWPQHKHSLSLTGSGPAGSELLAGVGRDSLVAISLADGSMTTIVSGRDFPGGEYLSLGRGLTWSADGWIHYSREFARDIGGVHVGGQEIWRVPASGGVPEPAIRTSDGTPYWHRGSIALSENGEMGFWTEPGEARSDVWIADAVDPPLGR
jgi:hypothetical protein